MSKKNRNHPRQPEPQPRQFPWLWLVMGVALVSLIAGGYLLWPSAGVDPNFVPEVSGAPKLAVDQTVSDAGYVKYGTPVQAAFRLQNVGDEPLQILERPQVELIEGC